MFSVEHLRCHNESLLHIEVGLGASLNEKLKIVFLRESFTLLSRYFSLSRAVALIADKNHDSIWLALRTYLVAPVLEVLEALHACTRVGE